MVKRLGVFLAYTAFFIGALMIFVPKTSLYFLLEKEIKPLGVVISDEKIKEHFLDLEINHMNISVKGIDSAKIEKASVELLGFYNTLALHTITLSSVASSFIPLHIESVYLRHNIINPLIVDINADGEFGKMVAKVNLKTRSLHAIVKPSQLMLQKYRTSLRELKKTKEGEFVYDVSF